VNMPSVALNNCSLSKNTAEICMRTVTSETHLLAHRSGACNVVVRHAIVLAAAVGGAARQRQRRVALAVAPALARAALPARGRHLLQLRPHLRQVKRREAG
jgi:hypothetical protein